MTNLPHAQIELLRALMAGSTLKSHRHLDGTKQYLLHPLEGAAEEVEWALVESLKNRGLIDSNKKFPAATYLLTDQGRALAERLAGPAGRPLSARNFGTTGQEK